MVNWKYVKYKKYAGYKIAGTGDVGVPKQDRHVERVFYLVAMLEAPKWGAVQSYDGCGMSAGPLHATAVLPRDKSQGPLWELLKLIGLSAPDARHALDSALWAAANWHIACDGKLRDHNGDVVSGDRIIAEFTGPRGVARRDDSQPLVWAGHFAELFSDPRTYAAQKQFTVDWLLRSNAALESEAYEMVVGGLMPDVMHWPMSRVHPAVDLAMCVYHAHSVNAPSKARSVLNKVLAKGMAPEKFAKGLIRALGTTRYGRWMDTEDNKNRYDRTRIVVERCGLWPEDVVSTMMPKNLR